MVQSFIKFIQKSPYKDRLMAIVQDIRDDHLEWYDVRALSGQSNVYRLRSGQIRFIFKKTPQGNRILRVGNRGDVYK